MNSSNQNSEIPAIKAETTERNISNQLDERQTKIKAETQIEFQSSMLNDSMDFEDNSFEDSGYQAKKWADFNKKKTNVEHVFREPKKN